MWLYMSDAFLSVVAHRHDKKKLLVRARFAGDIERVFGKDVIVMETPIADYRFRAVLPRNVVSAVLSRRLNEIAYDNFKNSVEDDWRHGDLMGIWSIMSRAQQRRAFPSYPPMGGTGSLLDDIDFPSNSPIDCEDM
jgi:hypothetical protein